jgi:serine/threonine-protein kinase
MVGQTISHYRIVEKLGEGGMGVVYKAEDLKLGRAVALKFLPSHWMESEEHKARFLHEARAAALLDHPNICTVHEIDEANGQTFLAMACLEGQTLKQKIAARPLPLAEALDIALQIGHGLQAAHQKGIVHRDIKPANIMITPQGQAKIMDFGLAQLSDRTKLTATGTKLGTPAYMSPEQTEGKTTDARADIWALGILLYEMVSGRVPFPGDTEAAVAHAVLYTEPEPLTALRSHVPMELDRILAKAIAKRPPDRYQHVDDLMVDLRRTHQRGQTPAISRRRFSRRAKVAALVAVAAGVALATLGAWALLRQEQPGAPRRVTRFAIVLPAAHRMPIPENDRDLVVSPDGRYIAFRVGGRAGGALAVRALDRMDVHLFSDITAARSPFFSPDSRWIGFSERGQLKKVSVAGGAPIVIGNNLGGGSASWADDNTIVYARNGRLLAVSANGGEPTLLAAPDGEDEYTLPSAVPGPRGILFTIRQRSPFFGGKARRSVADHDNVQVAVLDRTAGRHKVLIRGGTAAEYARSGHLLYAIAGTLFAARFDPDRLEMLGEPVPVVQGLQMALNAGAANYTVSHEGTLVYVPNTSGRRSLVWVDRNGAETTIPAPPRAYHALNLSPDGTRAALEIREEQDIFIWDFSEKTLTKLTFDPNMDCGPNWMPDGRRVLFSSTRDGVANLYAQTADGTGAVQRLTTSNTAQFVNSVTPDGAYVLGVQWSPKTAYDIVLFPLAGRVQHPGVAPAQGTNASIVKTLVQTPGVEYGAQISPDGRFFAYLSHESGRPEIYVRPFPGASEGRWQVSVNGGTGPGWAPSGRELFYLSSENALMSVAVQPSETTFRAGTPTKLLEAKYAAPGELGTYAVSPDGRRFLMMKETDVFEPTAAPVSMIVVLNWFEELRSRDQD